MSTRERLAGFATLTIAALFFGIHPGLADAPEWLTVRIQDYRGRPLPGATITIEGQVQGATDATGALKIERRPGMPETGNLLAAATGFAESRGAYAFPGERVLRLLPQSVLQGIVVRRTDGEVMPNLIVSALGSTTTTDVSGRFRIDGLPAFPGVIAAAGGGWYGSLEGFLQMVVGGVTEVRVAVEPAFTIRGRAHAGARLLPPGHYVQAGGFRMPAESAIGPDGRFELGNMPPGHHRLYLHEKRGNPKSALAFRQNYSQLDDVVIVDHDVEVDLDLGVRHSLEVEVVDQAGLPRSGTLVGASSTLQQKGRVSMMTTECITDVRGRCRFDGLPADDELSLGLGLRFEAAARKIALPHTAVVRLIAGPTADVEGRILTGDGLPHSGLRILAGKAQAVSGADGRFELANAPSGECSLDVIGWYNEPAWEKPAATRRITLRPGEYRQGVAIVLPPSQGQIAGRVILSSGAPAADVAVVLRGDWAPPGSVDEFDEGLDVAGTDSKGRFSFDRVPVATGFALSAYGPQGEFGWHGPVKTGDMNATLRLFRPSRVMLRFEGRDPSDDTVLVRALPKGLSDNGINGYGQICNVQEPCVISGLRPGPVRLIASQNARRGNLSLNLAEGSSISTTIKLRERHPGR
jgi:hypothetical protein